MNQEQELNFPIEANYNGTLLRGVIHSIAIYGMTILLKNPRFGEFGEKEFTGACILLAKPRFTFFQEDGTLTEEAVGFACGALRNIHNATKRSKLAPLIIGHMSFGNQN